MITEDKNIFSLGSRGSVVGLIQAKLKELGYELGSFGPNKDGIDNKYGSVTRDAVKDFQEDVFKNDTKKHDGIVGTDTWGELFPDEKYPLNVNDISKISKNVIKSLQTNTTSNFTTKTSNGTYPNLSGKINNVVDSILGDIQTIAAEKNWTVYVSSGHRPNDHDSRHKLGAAVDIAAINGNSYNKNREEFTRLGDELVDMLKSMGYVSGEYRIRNGKKIPHTKAYLWQTYSGGNHFHHIHASNITGVKSTMETGNSYSKIYRMSNKHYMTDAIKSQIIKGGPKKFPARGYLWDKSWNPVLKSKNVFVSDLGYKESGGDLYGYKQVNGYTNSISGELSYGFLWGNQSNYHYPNIKAKSKLSATIVDHLILNGGWWGSNDPKLFTYFKLQVKGSSTTFWLPSTWVSL